MTPTAAAIVATTIPAGAAQWICSLRNLRYNTDNNYNYDDDGGAAARARKEERQSRLVYRDGLGALLGACKISRRSLYFF